MVMEFKQEKGCVRTEKREGRSTVYRKEKEINPSRDSGGESGTSHLKGTRCVQTTLHNGTFTNGGDRTFKGIQKRSDGRNKSLMARKCRDYSSIRDYLRVVSYYCKAFIRCWDMLEKSVEILRLLRYIQSNFMGGRLGCVMQSEFIMNA